MIRVRAFQLALVGGAIVALEVLCRAGIIDRFTMIPPSEMLLALAGVMGTEPWFWPDVSYTLGNLAAAIALSVAGGFLIGLVVHAIPLFAACSIRFSRPTIRCRPSCCIRC
jgi:NitT/TauT family transport system permease protein